MMANPSKSRKKNANKEISKSASKVRSGHVRNGSDSTDDIEEKLSRSKDGSEETVILEKWSSPLARRSYQNIQKKKIDVYDFKNNGEKNFIEKNTWLNVKTFDKRIILYFVIISLLILYLSYITPYGSSNDEKEAHVTIESIREKFPNQTKTLWGAIITGINSTKHLNHPTSYIFLFENEAEETVKQLLHDISKYAVCKLTNCNSSAINFTEVIQSNPSITDDYGSIIANVSNKLESNGLMIIENLDEVPEKYAMAFHNFCDEITPIVGKSAFFFTMKIDKFETSVKNDLRKVEEILARKWSHIEEDKFGPLFARISGMPLRIYP